MQELLLNQVHMGMKLLGANGAREYPITLVWRAGQSITCCFSVVEKSTIEVTAATRDYFRVIVNTFK